MKHPLELMESSVTSPLVQNQGSGGGEKNPVQFLVWYIMLI